jgi:F0F1-type ATP synthase assembly protein I
MFLKEPEEIAMPKRQASSRFIAGANRSMEEILTRNERTIFASYRLVGAILLFGAAGYLLDRWLMTTPWLLMVGLLTGIAVGFLGLLRVVRRR